MSRGPLLFFLRRVFPNITNASAISLFNNNDLLVLRIVVSKSVSTLHLPYRPIDIESAPR